MNQIKATSIFLILLIATIPTASASIIDDHTKNTFNAQSLSLTGTQTAACGDGTTECIMSGDIFTIRSDVVASAEKIQLTVPTGTVFTLADSEVTTTSSITLELIPRTPYMTVPLIAVNNKYKYAICDTTGCLFPSDKYLTSYTKYGDAKVTTRYALQLWNKDGTTQTKEVSYNYTNNTVKITARGGETATVLAKSHNTGMVFEPDYFVIIPDENGIGGYSIFNRIDFERKLKSQYSIEQWRIDGWNRPKSWTEFLSRMKSNGLRPLPIGYGTTPYTLSGTNLTVNYEKRHTGTSVEARFPKTMVTSITELSASGKHALTPTLEPKSITMGIMSGDIFTIRSDVVASAEKLQLTAPTGTAFTLADSETTTSPVALELIPRTPYMTVPVTINNDQYSYFINDQLFPNVKYLTSYTKYGDAKITTRYALRLWNKDGTTQTKEVSYDYTNPTLTNTVKITARGGETATVLAKSQLSTGMVFDPDNFVVVPDENGIGGYSIFNRIDFERKLKSQNSIEGWRLDSWNRPKSWTEFLSRMKSNGLRPLPIGFGTTPYTLSGTNLIVNYEKKHVGTSVEARFPKTMVTSITELLANGKPHIDSIT